MLIAEASGVSRTNAAHQPAFIAADFKERVMENDYSSVWVNGKVEPGFYMDRAVWSKIYAEELRAQGYEVERRIPDPKHLSVYIAVPDNWDGVTK